MRLAQFIAAIAATAIFGVVEAKAQDHIELAARINVAENICNINFGQRLLHHVMLASAERNITPQQAAVLAYRRHARILAHLNRDQKLDQFCQNARSGRL
ncbi:MAG: hypothetical protein ACK4HF_04650 [Paracoccaceae bacterium]